MLPFLEGFDCKALQTKLLSWYAEYRRELPWRKSRDPYKIWVSEIMLQQTRVDTVIPYFERFIEMFPTLEALAEADEEEVLKAWEGLGYYSRATNLQTAVREVKERYGGKVPDDEEEIASLKGVGPYTAGAILSIAYNKPVPAVDGNVMRVLSRLLLIDEEIGKAKTRKTFAQVARKLIPSQSPGDFNQALMELGAIICTPQAPACLLCPVQEECRAFKQGIQEDLPNKKRKKPPKPVNIAVAVLSDGDGRFLIRRRPNQGLLANLWEFPNCETTNGKDSLFQLQQFLQQDLRLNATIDEALMDFTHVFTHIKWQLSVYRGKIQANICEEDDVKLVQPTQLQAFPFSVSHQKIIERVVR